MYKQRFVPKHKAVITVILILLLMFLPTGLYILSAFFLPSVDPKSAAAGALLIFLLAVYFIFKPLFSHYEYTFSDDILTVKRLSVTRRGDRVLNIYTVNKADICEIRDGNGGKHLYPFGNTPCTLLTKNGKLSVVSDKALLNYLSASSVTDAFIENHFDEMLENLKKLIAIPSVKSEKLDGMPFGRDCADALSYTLALCERLGMRTKNLDNYCGYAEIGNGEKLIGVLCHLDVVPAGDGWDSDPFDAVIKDDEIFGRGAIDDKGPCIASIYALAACADAISDLKCRVRLIFGCDEESGWQCMDKYNSCEEAPLMAFTPDAEYPVITTEKGIAQIRMRSNLDEGDYQLYIRGGLRPNMVPDKAHATVIGNTDKFFFKLNDYDAHAHGISFTVKGNVLDIEADGIAAHGSTPEKGKNAFFELFRLLDMLELGGSQGEFVKTMLRCFVDKCDGSGVNLKLSDGISGELSLNLGMCFIGKNDIFSDMLDDTCISVIDIRYPVSYPLSNISAALQASLPDNWECDIEHGQAPHCVDGDSPLVTTLKDVYAEYTSLDPTPLAIGGGTYARAFPHKAVAFGAQLPGRPDKAHQPNESFSLEDLKLSAKMFACAIGRLASLE